MCVNVDNFVDLVDFSKIFSKKMTAISIFIHKSNKRFRHFSTESVNKAMREGDEKNVGI